VELEEETAVLAKGTVWQNLGSIALKATSFIYTILIARFVSQEDVGLFYFALGIVGVISIFGDLGLSQTLQRYVPYYMGKKDKVSASRILALAIFASTALVVAVAAITFLLSDSIAGAFENPRLAMLLEFFAIYLVINQVSNICQATLVAFKKMKERAIGNNVQNALKLALTAALVFLLGPSAKIMAVAFILSFAAGSFYLLRELHRVLTQNRLAPIKGVKWCLPLLREILPFGITVVSIAGFSIIMSYADRAILGFLLKEDANVQIAIYALASSLASLAVIFSGSISAILLPVASGLAGEQNLPKMLKAASTSLRWGLFLSIPFVAFLMAFSAPMLRVLYGAAYEPGAMTLALFAMGYLFSLLGTVQGTMLAAHRLVKIELFAFIIAAMANVLLNVLLIPPFGISGSAFAIMASFAIIFGINHHFVRLKFGFHMPAGTWKNVAAGVLVFAFLFALQSMSYGFISALAFQFNTEATIAIFADKILKLAVLGVFLFAGCLIYLALLNLMRLFEKEDRAVFEKLMAYSPVPEGIRSRISSIVFWSLNASR